MGRFSPIRVMRNIVAFFRRDIFRAFFSHEERRVRVFAYLGVFFLILTVFGDTYLLTSLTKQINVVIAAHEKGTLLELETQVAWAFAMYVGFFAIDCIRQIMSQKFSWHWREHATCHYLGQLHLVSQNVRGVSQRMTDAVKAFTMQAPDACIPVIRAFVLSVMLVPMLWSLSDFFMVRFPAKGILVYFVFIYCAIQTYVSIRWGKPLISLQSHGQAMEAALRDPLVLIESRRSTVDERVMQRRTRGIKKHVREALRDVNFKIIWGSVRLNGWKGFNVQVFAAALPILLLLAKMGYVTDDFGALMQMAGALTAMHGSVAIGSEVMFKWTEAGGSLSRLDDLEQREGVFEQTYASAAE